MPDVDVAILGGGCAGLSLAMRLARTRLSFRIVEPRQSYTDDRSWSFWRIEPHPFEDILSGDWPAWSIEGPSGLVRRSTPDITYQTLGAQAFYDRAGLIIDGAPNGSLALGVRAERVSPGKVTEVQCSDGSFTARHVIDTRPPALRPDYGQFFVGREILADRPIFDAGCVQLMHFRSGYSNGVDFLYVLPFSATRALVEVTTFAPTSPSYAVFDAWLSAEIETLVGASAFEVLREESGALPMQVGYRAPEGGGVTHMGLAGGAVRPSTGYAFQRIQTQALTLAAQLAAREPPRLPRDSAFTTFMDLVFLKVLAKHPDRAPAMFQSLFANCPPGRLERFLSGSTRAADRVSVMSSLPPRPFLAAAIGMP